MSARVSGPQIHFLSLQTAIFCVQCELFSANSTPSWLACGSKAVLGLSRLLGGSLRSKPAARLIEDAELDRLVRELLHTVPSSEGEGESEYEPSVAGGGFLPQRHHERQPEESGAWQEPPITTEHVYLDPAIGVIAHRAQVLARATGVALALRNANE